MENGEMMDNQIDCSEQGLTDQELQSGLKSAYYHRFQDLRDLQAMFPFVQIDPPIGGCQTQALPARTCIEFPIPPNAKMFRISSAGNLQVLMARSRFEAPSSSYSETQGAGVMVVTNTSAWRYAPGSMSIWIMALQDGFASVEYYIE